MKNVLLRGNQCHRCTKHVRFNAWLLFCDFACLAAYWLRIERSIMQKHTSTSLIHINASDADSKIPMSNTRTAKNLVQGMP